MLNAEDYPHALVEVHGYEVEFPSCVNHRRYGLYADVRITLIFPSQTN